MVTLIAGVVATGVAPCFTLRVTGIVEWLGVASCYDEEACNIQVTTAGTPAS